MGLHGDQQKQRTLTEVFPPGTPFRLLGAELKGTAEGTFGQRLVANIAVSAVTEPDTVLQFGVWGSLAEQLTEVEPGELPAIVTLSDSSGVWRFAPHGPEPIATENGTVPQRVDAEAHLDFEAGADSPLGPVSERSAPPPPPVEEGGHGNPAPDKAPTVKPTELDDSQSFQPGQK